MTGNGVRVSVRCFPISTHSTHGVLDAVRMKRSRSRHGPGKRRGRTQVTPGPGRLPAKRRVRLPAAPGCLLRGLAGPSPPPSSCSDIRSLQGHGHPRAHTRSSELHRAFAGTRAPAAHTTSMPSPGLNHPFRVRKNMDSFLNSFLVD